MFENRLRITIRIGVQLMIRVMDMVTVRVRVWITSTIILRVMLLFRVTTNRVMISVMVRVKAMIR